MSVRMDLESGRIDNKWIVTGFLTGLCLFCTGVTGSGMRISWLLAGILIPVLIGWIPFRMHALGAGDIKLLMLIGCLNGHPAISYTILFSFLFAAGISLGRLLSIRQLHTSLQLFFHYVNHVLIQKKIQAYPGRYLPGHTIHFSVAIFLGYAAWLGVVICSSMLFT